MLTTIDIQRILRGVDHFGGIFPLNRLPLVFKKPRLFIINLDPSYQQGTHWVAVHFDRLGYAYYFDSFGRPPAGQILTFLERFAPRGYQYSKDKIQDDNSTSCGYFCVLFVKLSPKKFFKIFKKCKTANNEQKLIKFIKHFV